MPLICFQELVREVCGVATLGGEHPFCSMPALHICFQELVREVCGGAMEGGEHVDEKNIRRRVYDAINVLLATNVIKKVCEKEKNRKQTRPAHLKGRVGSAWHTRAQFFAMQQPS